MILFYYRVFDDDGTKYEGELKTTSHNIYEWKERAIQTVKRLKRNREGLHYEEKRFRSVLVSNDFERVCYVGKVGVKT